MENSKSRLIAFVKYKKLSAREFSRIIGVSGAYLSSDSSVDLDILATIITHFPELNTHWIVTGQGNMLNWDYLPQPHNLRSPLNAADTQEIMNLRMPVEETILLLRDKVTLLMQEMNLLKLIIERQNDIIANSNPQQD